jgi:hypothetical protein
MYLFIGPIMEFIAINQPLWKGSRRSVREIPRLNESDERFDIINVG